MSDFIILIGFVGGLLAIFGIGGIVQQAFQPSRLTRRQRVNYWLDYAAGCLLALMFGMLFGSALVAP